jgi:RNA polymerase primary sigma factor
MKNHDHEDIDYTTRQYAIELSRVKLLTKEEEELLYKRYKKHNDIEARNKLIESCLRFVVKLAAKYSKDIEHQKIFISAGNEGLLTAIERYDPSKGTRFLSYASWYIMLFIREEIYKDSAVPMPTWRKKLYKKLIDLKKEFIEVVGREPTMEELAEAANTTPKQVRAVLTANHAIISINDEDISEAVEIDMQSAMANMEDKAISKDSADFLHKILSTLPVREQFIVRAYYGLVFDDPLSLKQIAGLLGISSERVRQIKAEALEQIKEVLEQYGIKDLTDII